MDVAKHVEVDVNYLRNRAELIKKLKESTQENLEDIVNENNLNYTIISIKSKISISLKFSGTAEYVDANGQARKIEHKNKIQHVLDLPNPLGVKNEFLEHLDAGVLREDIIKRMDTVIYPIKMSYTDFVIANIQKSIGLEEVSFFKLLKSTKNSIYDDKGNKLKRVRPNSSDVVSEDKELKELIEKFKQYCSPLPAPNPNEAKKPKLDNVNSADRPSCTIFSIRGKEDITVHPAVEIPSASENLEETAVKPSSEEMVSSRIISNADIIKQTYSELFERRGFVSLREMMKLDRLKVEKKEVSTSVGKLLDEYIAKEEGKRISSGNSSAFY